jgi:hypothetical protein
LARCSSVCDFLDNEPTALRGLFKIPLGTQTFLPTLTLTGLEPALLGVSLYTPRKNNKLTLAEGFQVPESLRETDQILDVSVGTDSSLAMRTRRGTGFYKIPSLRGVWYRNAFDHMGQAQTLEEWFDPARLNPDYVPHGFHLGQGPIKGHEFGLKLSGEDRRSLIGFLKTL